MLQTTEFAQRVVLGVENRFCVSANNRLFLECEFYCSRVLESLHVFADQSTSDLSTLMTTCVL